MDICTRKLLVEGPSREWLYPWPSSHPPSAGTAPYVGEKAPTDYKQIPFFFFLASNGLLPIINLLIYLFPTYCFRYLTHTSAQCTSSYHFYGIIAPLVPGVCHNYFSFFVVQKFHGRSSW